MSAYSYPLNFNETNTYSENIENYNRLTKDDIKLLVNDFIEFVKYMYYMKGLPCPTEAQIAMAWYIWKSPHKYRQVLAERGLAKSMTSQFYVLWRLLRNKKLKIAVVSATERRAGNYTTFLLNTINEIPLLKHMYPESNQRKSTLSFDVSGSGVNDTPSVVCYSIGSPATGARSNLVVYDDIETVTNSVTPNARETLLLRAMEFINTGIAGEKESICLCTYQSSESIYLDMQDKGFVPMFIPSRYPTKQDVQIKYQDKLAPFIMERLKADPSLYKDPNAEHGEPIDERLNEEHLLENELLIGKSQYELQYQLNPQLSDEFKFPLKLRDLIVMDLNHETAPIHIEYTSDKKYSIYDLKHHGFRGDLFLKPRYISNNTVKYEAIAMFIDPSGQGEDETTYCVTAHVGGRIFLLDFGGFKGGYEDSTLDALSDIAIRFNVNTIEVESNFGDGTFAKLLQPHLRDKGFTKKVIDHRATTNKEARICETLEPIMNQHRLIVDKGALERDYAKYRGKLKEYSMTYQLTHIFKQKDALTHDDLADVLERGVMFWLETLARSKDVERQRHEDAELDKEVAEFMEHAKSNRGVSKKRGWIY